MTSKPNQHPSRRQATSRANTNKHRNRSPETQKKLGKLHPRNPHQGRYDFTVLTQAFPKLADYTISNPKGEPTVDFSDANAVRVLNQALLAHYYGVKFWDLPEGYLCPPIPGRADYIHYIADLLAQTTHSSDDNLPPKGKNIHALDIGTGASVIYPIIGSQSYGWRFTATDIDPVSVNTAALICDTNPKLKSAIKVKLQPDSRFIFKNIIGRQDYFDVTLCNPPFHASLAEAMDANSRKQFNLQRHRASNANSQISQSSSKSKNARQNLNFGGQHQELWSHGGEIAFLTKMAKESQDFAEHVGWFTSLVSKSENVKPLQLLLKQLGATQVRIIEMSQGQKNTRVIAWRFETDVSA
ncbi:23S rRNA (adenine(1618)-N(6))-methyltransferase RlmF [Psychrobacter ciconiae]|uniref:23S rRNA (adenine(1618)-N(6))-methyltransferase RlmF n=1 Tax=Psychrobacter ciconiae TaxID=1553449 RepID=UPI001919C4A4|nr:23S rRNA (adenine(1618)-N(6))-methyltransferase RlmF [Psychrobacter ciconiae]